MVPETHRTIASELRNRIAEDYGILLDESKLLRGSVAPDIYPKYKFIPHYCNESLDYIVEKIVSLVPFLEELAVSTSRRTVLVYPVSYNFGVISHYLCDYMTYPHARDVHCTSMKDLREHMLYEKDLNHYTKVHGLDRDCIIGMRMGVFRGDRDELRVFVKEQILELIRLYLEEEVAYKNDLNFAYILNMFIWNTVYETATNYDCVGNVQMA